MANADITYNFESNYQTLDLIRSIIGDAETMKEEITALFNTLTSGPYVGQAATEINALHVQFSREIEDIIHDMRQAHVRAVDQNQLVQDLDNQQAANILG